VASVVRASAASSVAGVGEVVVVVAARLAADGRRARPASGLRRESMLLMVDAGIHAGMSRLARRGQRREETAEAVGVENRAVSFSLARRSA
jgi:hypothetical protein